MKVSVLMVTYNQEKFVAQAIESVVNQEVNFEYEIVIGEDHSTDSTRTITIDYYKKYPDKIRLLLRDQNLGVYSNFAQTLSACQGEYIAILEGDDYWTSSQKLQKQVNFLDEHPECSICFHNVIEFYEARNFEPRLFRPSNQKRVSSIEDLLTHNFIHTPSVMYRGLVRTLPSWFQDFKLIDWPLHILNSQYGSIGYIDEVMAAYRIHSQGVWATKSDELRLKETIYMLEKIRENIDQKYESITKLALARFYDSLAGVYRLRTEEQHQEIIKSLLPNIPLNQINLIVFPNWKQLEESLYEDLASIIKAILLHPDISHTALLIDSSDITENEANMAVSAVLMNLLMEDNLEFEEEPEISILPSMDLVHWQVLRPYLHARITFNNENQQAITLAGLQQLKAYDIDIFRKTRNIWLEFQQPYKLHIGCGSVKFDGWINIDINGKEKAVDLVCDTTKGLPFADNSCELIYNEHFLEHLEVEQGLSFLTECYRVLKPDGVIRIAMPSLEDTVKNYSSANWRNQDWLTWPEYQFIQTRAEMINIAFRWWGHQWLYDREELHRRLTQAGFEKIRDVNWGVSDVSELKNRETRKDSILICEAEK